MKIQQKSTLALVLNNNNARVHSEYQISQLVKSIQEFGFNNPLLIDEKNILIAGHGRLEAAKILGLKEVPVIVLSHLSDRQKTAFALADNRITLNSSWDLEKLAEEVSKLADADFDLGLLGFNEEELDNMLRSADILPELPGYETFAPVVPTENVPEQLPGQTIQNPASLPKAGASHDDYSLFEQLMLHPKKVRFVEALNHIRQEQSIVKLEDAMMFLVDFYYNNQKES